MDKSTERRNVMRKWEHKEETIEHASQIVKTANKAGEDGWELVNVLPCGLSGPRAILFFKREILEPAKKIPIPHTPSGYLGDPHAQP
ncbi:MAG: hypothetical protein ABIJ84_01520 [bacterium]